MVIRSVHDRKNTLDLRNIQTSAQNLLFLLRNTKKKAPPNKKKHVYKSLLSHSIQILFSPQKRLKIQLFVVFHFRDR